MEEDEPQSRARHFRSVAERLRSIAEGLRYDLRRADQLCALLMASIALQTDLNNRPMPYQSLEEEVAILRAKAEKLREMATAHTTPLSPQLAEMAEELETRAETLARRLRTFRGQAH